LAGGSLARATGKTTFREHCARVEGGIMWGMEYTLIDAKLTSFEAMRIELDSDNMLVFVPRPFENRGTLSVI